jgi:hypothetical protein
LIEWLVVRVHPPQFHFSPVLLMKFFRVLLALCPLLLEAQAGQVVAVDGVSVAGNLSPWRPVVTGSPFINVTENAPRMGFGNVGAGSLEMRINQMDQYAFWRRDSEFGMLHDMTRLSFDWFRLPVGNWDAPVGSIDDTPLRPIPSVDWYYKTPVLRLHLRERRAGSPDVFSELVWEGYFNRTTPTPVNTWVTESAMHTGNFWYVSSAGYDLGTCSDPMTVWQGGIRAMTYNEMFMFGCLQGATVDVTGISVGIGSQWPLEYAGFVDNVQMDMANTAVLTWVLLLTGGIVIFGVMWYRRRTT